MIDNRAVPRCIRIPSIAVPWGDWGTRMPMYEYYCRACNGVFELLRSARQSTDSQPCPDCDAESERLMPTTFTAFTVRDGLPRSIPDRGTFWHLGQEVKRPVNEPALPFEHPDLDKHPETMPSAEEIEAFDHQLDRDAHEDAEADARGMLAIQPQREMARGKFVQRLAATGTINRLRPRKRSKGTSA